MVKSTELCLLVFQCDCEGRGPSLRFGVSKSMQPPRLSYHILYLGQEEMLERRRERDRRIEPRDANDRSVKILKGFFVDDGGDLAGKTTGLGVLVEKNDFVGLLHGLNDGRAIERRERAQVENLDLDSFLGQQIGGFLRRVYHSGVSNDAEIAALAMQARFADRDRVIVFRYLVLDAAIEKLVLQE